MRRVGLFALMLSALVLPALPLHAAEVSLQKLRLAQAAGFTVTPAAAPSAVTLSFDKATGERRLLAVEGTPTGALAGMKLAEISYALELTKGEAPRPAVLVFEKGGGVWYKVAGTATQVGAEARANVSVAGLTQAAFSEDRSGALEWDQVERVLAGFVFDGPAAGKLRISGVRLLDQAAKPTQPLRLTGSGIGKWSDSHDPAIQATQSLVKEGPAGQEVMKYEFTVPAGRHMYATPQTNILAEDLEGYSALSFQLRAQIPEGMRLLVQVGENSGAIYFVEPPGPWPAQWADITIPLSQFKQATWGPKDENGRFDAAGLHHLSIGTHGVPKQGGPGLIMVTDVELIP